MFPRAVFASLPCTVGGFCATNADGERICILNSNLTREQNIQTYMHEIQHINDHGELEINTLETRRHKTMFAY